MRTKEQILKEIEETKKKLTELENELAGLNGEVEIKWESEWTDRRKHGKPYLAILTKGENGRKFNFEFLDTVDQYRKHDVKSRFSGLLKEGTILKGRVGASWNNDYSCFYEVTESGLEAISEEEALKKLEII